MLRQDLQTATGLNAINLAYEDRVRIVAKTVLKTGELYCSRCHERRIFSSKGVAGTALKTGRRKLQIKCDHCSASSFFLAVLKETSSKENNSKLLKSAKQEMDVIETDYQTAIQPFCGEIQHEVRGPLEAYIYKQNGKRSKPDTPNDSAEQTDLNQELQGEILRLRTENERLSNTLKDKEEALKIALERISELESFKAETNARIDALEKSFSAIKTGNGPATVATEIANDQTFEPIREAARSIDNSKKQSYSQAARRNVKNTSSPADKALKRAAMKALQPQAPPTEFARIQFHIPNPQGMKQARSNIEKMRLLWAMVRQLGIRRAVFEASRIGNSICEIYVPMGEKIAIEQRLKFSKIDVVTINPLEAPPHTRISPEKMEEIVRFRKLRMYCKAQLTRLKECIISDLPQYMAEEIKMEAALRKTASSEESPDAEGDEMHVTCDESDASL